MPIQCFETPEIDLNSKFYSPIAKADLRLTPLTIINLQSTKIAKIWRQSQNKSHSEIWMCNPDCAHFRSFQLFPKREWAQVFAFVFTCIRRLYWVVSVCPRFAPRPSIPGDFVIWHDVNHPSSMLSYSDNFPSRPLIIWYWPYLVSNYAFLCSILWIESWFGLQLTPFGLNWCIIGRWL